MKRFVFQFESILRLRKLREDEALRTLGTAQRALGVANDEKSALFAKLEASLVRRENLGSAPVEASAFRMEQDFITGQKSRLVRQEQVIVRAQRSVEKAFRTYLGARRQTEMMARLRERHFTEFRRARARAEQKEQEDLAVMRAPLIAAEKQESEELDALISYSGTDLLGEGVA